MNICDVKIHEVSSHDDIFSPGAKVRFSLFGGKAITGWYRVRSTQLAGMGAGGSTLELVLTLSLCPTEGRIGAWPTITFAIKAADTPPTEWKLLRYSEVPTHNLEFIDQGPKKFKGLTAEQWADVAKCRDQEARRARADCGDLIKREQAASRCLSSAQKELGQLQARCERAEAATNAAELQNKALTKALTERLLHDRIRAEMRAETQPKGDKKLRTSTKLMPYQLRLLHMCKLRRAATAARKCGKTLLAVMKLREEAKDPKGMWVNW